MLKAYPSENTRKAICLGRFVQSPINEISLLWDFDPEKNICLDLPIHPIIHLADKEILQIFYQKELVKITNKKGLEINKLCQHENLSGPIQFISSLGYFKAEKIREALNIGTVYKEAFLNSRDELHSLIPLKNFPLVIKECKEFFLIKTSVNNTKIMPKNPFEALNIGAENFELMSLAIQLSPLYEKNFNLEQNLKRILVNKLKASQINTAVLMMNFPEICEIKNLNSPKGLKKYALLDIINQLNESNVIAAGSEFKSVKFSDLMRNQCNLNLVHAKLVTAKILKIDLEDEKIHCRLFNGFKALLPFANILQGSNEFFISKMLETIKVGDYISARIHGLNEEKNSFELFFPTQIFVENFFKPNNKSCNVKHNFNPLWRFFKDEIYYTGQNLKFPELSDGTYSYNNNRFFIENLILNFSSTIKNEKGLFDYLAMQSKYFLLVNYQTAKDCLINFDYDCLKKDFIFVFSQAEKMPFLIIPSEKHPSEKLFVVLKVFNNKFWKIPIEIIKQENNNNICSGNYCNSAIEVETENKFLNLKFKINEKVFSSLNELVEKYLINLLNVLKAFSGHKKFADYLNKEHFEDVIQNKNKRTKPIAEYSYTIFSEFPLYILLGYFIKENFLLEFIKVTPNNFIYCEKEFNNPDEISAIFKVNFNNYLLNIPEKLALEKQTELKILQTLEKSEEFNIANIEANELSSSAKKHKNANSVCISQEVEMLIDSSSFNLKNSLKQSISMEDLKQEEADNFTFLGVKRERPRSQQQELKIRESIPDIFKEAEEKPENENMNKDHILMGLLEDAFAEENAEKMLIDKEENAFLDFYEINKNELPQAHNHEFKDHLFLGRDENVDKEIEKVYDTNEANKTIMLDFSPLKMDDLKNPIVEEIEKNINSFPFNDKTSNNNPVISDNKAAQEDLIGDWGKADNANENNFNSNNNNNNFAFNSNSNSNNEMKIDEWGNEIKQDNSNNSNSNENNNNNNANNIWNTNENYNSNSNSNNDFNSNNKNNNNYSGRNNCGSDSRDFNSDRPYRGRGDRGRGDRGRGRGFNSDSSGFRGRDRNNNDDNDGNRDRNGNNFNRNSRDFSRDDNRRGNYRGGRGGEERGRGRNNYNSHNENIDGEDNYKRRSRDEINNSSWRNGNQESSNNLNNSNQNNNNDSNQINSEAKSDWGAIESGNINSNQDLDWGNEVSSNSDNNAKPSAENKSNSEWNSDANNNNNINAQNTNSNQNSEWGSDCNSKANSDNNNNTTDNNNFNFFGNSSSSNTDWNSNSNSSQFGTSRNYSCNDNLHYQKKIFFLTKLYNILLFDQIHNFSYISNPLKFKLLLLLLLKIILKKQQTTIPETRIAHRDAANKTTPQDQKAAITAAKKAILAVTAQTRKKSVAIPGRKAASTATAKAT